MNRTPERARRYVVLTSDRGDYERYLGKRVSLCGTTEEIEQTYNAPGQGPTWISFARGLTDELLRVASRLRGGTSQRDEWVVTVAPPRPESLPALQGLFAHVVGGSSRYRWLAREELADVLLDPEEAPADLFIAVASDSPTQTLTLIDGDCRQHVVPFSLFESAGDGTEPDFSKPHVTDFGRTIVLGDYEAGADAILYETKAGYRKKLKQQREASERTFGASLRRLRKQRRLSRDDFRPVSAKTIARIERNEIEKPHGKTLQTIARRLGVSPDEIGEY